MVVDEQGHWGLLDGWRQPPRNPFDRQPGRRQLTTHKLVEEPTSLIESIGRDQTLSRIPARDPGGQLVGNVEQATEQSQIARRMLDAYKVLRRDLHAPSMLDLPAPSGRSELVEFDPRLVRPRRPMLQVRVAAGAEVCVA